MTDLDLRSILTLDEAFAISVAQGLSLHPRYDLLKVCRARLVPAQKRGGVWLLTKPCLQTYLDRVRGLGLQSRRALYAGPPLVPLDAESAVIPAGLLVGYKEIVAFAAASLGWHIGIPTMTHHRPRLEHRLAGRTMLTTHEAVRALFRQVWSNKIKRLGLPDTSSNLALTLVRVTQVLLGLPLSDPADAQVVATLEQAVVQAQGPASRRPKSKKER